MLKWWGATRPCLCLQLLNKMLRGINISRSANVWSECVCVFLWAWPRRRLCWEYGHCFSRRMTAGATGQTRGFSPLLEPDVFVGKGLYKKKKKNKAVLSLYVSHIHTCVHICTLIILQKRQEREVCSSNIHQSVPCRKCLWIYNLLFIDWVIIPSQLSWHFADQLHFKDAWTQIDTIL